MKVVARFFFWTFLIALAGVAALAVDFFGNAIRPSRTVGMAVAAAPDPGHANVNVVLFYPAEGRARLTLIGMGLVAVATDAPINPGRHPLIVISHGTGAGPASHIDTAIALAEQGYIVAALMHNGDNFQDQSQVGAPTWMTDRARQVVHINDFLLTAWSGHESIDPEKIGLFGFSAGATTALINIGATPDFSLVASACETRPEFVCQLLQPDTVLQSPSSVDYFDPRIKAAVLAAPGLGTGFTQTSLERVRVPVQVWAAEADANAPARSNAAAIAGLLPNRPMITTVPGASHFSFLAPCSLVTRLAAPMLCADSGGFDRAAFHRAFNADVVAFFGDNLNVAAATEQP
jgi:predicted dienelactone hydrolase